MKYCTISPTKWNVATFTHKIFRKQNRHVTWELGSFYLGQNSMYRYLSIKVMANKIPLSCPVGPLFCLLVPSSNTILHVQPFVRVSRNVVSTSNTILRVKPFVRVPWNVVWMVIGAYKARVNLLIKILEENHKGVRAAY